MRTYLPRLAINASKNSYPRTHTCSHPSCEFSALESKRPGRCRCTDSTTQGETLYIFSREKKKDLLMKKKIERKKCLGCTTLILVMGIPSSPKILSEKARAETASLPPHANTKTMSFSLHCSTSTQSSRVSTSSLTSNATSKRVVQRKAFRVRAADAGTC